MQSIAKTSPYIRKATSTKRMMIDVLIALIPVVAFAVYRFKLDFLSRALIAVVIAVITEAVCFGLMKEKEETYKDRFQKFTVNNIVPPIITALIFVLTLPNKISLVVVIAGILFAMVIGKMIFGGLGRNIFNPAGIGRAFVALAFASLFAGTYGDVDSIAGVTALGGNFPEILATYSLGDLFFGNIPGSMGEISALAIIIGGVYLLIRRAADYRIIASALGVFTLFMLVAGIGLGVESVLNYTLFHLLSGGLLFGVVFMATDPITSPYTRQGRLIYGALIGGLVAIIRLFGALPEGMVFALVIANGFVPLIDYRKWSTNIYRKKFIIGYAVVIVITALIVFAGVGGF